MIESIQLIVRIKAIHQNLKNRTRGVQASISSSTIVKILILSTPWMQKWVYKRLGTRDSRDLVSKQFDLLQLLLNALQSWKTSPFIGNLGVTVDETLNLRSTALMKRIRANQIWTHEISPRRESYKNACNARRWIAIRRVDVFFVCLISSGVTPLYQRLRLKRNPMNPISPCTPLT